MRIRHIAIATMLLMLTSLGTANAQTCCLKLTLDVNQMFRPDCNLTGAAFVYLYSGLCTGQLSGVNCKDWTPREGEVWQYIVGYFDEPPFWTLMTDEGNGIYTKYIDINNYYGNAAYISDMEGIGLPMPSSETPKSLGVVFGNEDGSISGRDETCNDIFVTGLEGPNPSVIQSCGTGCTTPFDFPPLTAEWVTSVPTGIEEFKEVAFLRAFPNPFSVGTQIKFSLTNNVKDLTIKIYDAVGKEVRTLFEGEALVGDHVYSWEGKDDLGVRVTSGLYYFTLTSDNTSEKKKLIYVN